jgi:hypothetical protein
VARFPCIVEVRGSHGQVLPHTRIVVESASEPMPEMAYVTDQDGRAQVGLPAGEVGLRMFLADGTSRTSSLRVADEPGRTYALRLAT